jgi:hypothetical protein
VGGQEREREAEEGEGDRPQVGVVDPALVPECRERQQDQHDEAERGVADAGGGDGPAHVRKTVKHHRGGAAHDDADAARLQERVHVGAAADRVAIGEHRRQHAERHDPRLAPAHHAYEQQWPQQVELFLDGQRPKVDAQVLELPDAALRVEVDVIEPE